MAKMRILLVDDHEVLRSGLRLLINSHADAEVVGEASDTREGMQKVRELEPDVAVVDLTIPGAGGMKLIEQIRHEAPRTRIVVLTMHDDPAYVRAALAAGANAYVAKTAADAELLTAIRAAFRGRSYVNVALKDASPGSLLTHPTDKATTPGDSLSPREREVLKLLALGHTNQEIADKLILSVKTIETYRARLGDKLGIKTRAEMVRYALELGIIGAEQAT